MNNYKILNEAVFDLEAATTWYEEQREGLGLELIEEFHQHMNTAVEMHKSGTIVGFTPGGSEIRRYRFRKFKRYAVLVAIIDEIPTVLAVTHSSRWPGFWLDRLM